MKESKKRWLSVFTYLIDYLPILITVTAATIASISAVRSNITTTELLQWILLILAMLATTQLVDRLRLMRSLESKVNAIAHNATNPKGAEDFFSTSLPSFSERLKSARTIAINGMTLSRTSNTFYQLFRQCATSGGQVRLLIIDPRHKAIEIAASRFIKHQDPRRIIRESEHTLDNLQAIVEDQEASKGFEVRLASFVPPYGIWMLDIGTPQEEIWVELYSFQADMDPAIQLLPYRDGTYFNFFKQQLEKMWQASRALNASDYQQMSNY